MACMGPSKTFSEEQAKKAKEEVIKLLKEKYQAFRPELTLGIGFEKKMQREWDEAEQQLEEILIELIWTSDCASW